MTRSHGTRARGACIIVMAGVASPVAAVVLAPIMTVGWCADAPAGGASVCHSEPRSLLGGYAPWWLWLTAQLAIFAAMAGALRRLAREWPRRLPDASRRVARRHREDLPSDSCRTPRRPAPPNA